MGWKRSAPYGAYNRGSRWKKEPGSMFNCTSLDQWQSPEADNYQGLRVSRWIDPLRWQCVADELSKQTWAEDILNQEIIKLDAPANLIEQKIRDGAIAVSRGVPLELAELVCQDAQALAIATHKMLPQAQQMIMKLELFGENVCSRWHRDQYVCRSLVAYNCSGTDYTVESNVDFWEMKNCGNNDHIIRNKSLIYNANAGDMVMIKGSKFPGKVKGLVHKSPEVRYFDNGDVQSRLVLKVDVEEFAAVRVQNECSGD